MGKVSILQQCYIKHIFNKQKVHRLLKIAFPHFSLSEKFLIIRLIYNIT